MKKFLVVLIILIVIIVGLAIALPILLKDQLLEKAKSTINENVEAKVEFADFNLSIFRHFPRITIELEDVIISGVGEFESDTLLEVKSLRTALSLATILNKDKRSIEEIFIDNPKVNLIVNNKGENNWTIVKTQEKEKETDGTQKSFNLQLDKIDIENGNLKYSDFKGNMFADLQDLDVDISGKMYGSNTRLKTNGKVEKINFNYDGIQYIADTRLEAKTDLDVNYKTMLFAIADNEMLINQLPLELTGNVAMPDDKMTFDLQLDAKESGFDKFLALTPPTYQKYLKGVKAQGEAKIAGNIKGDYFDSIYPAINLLLAVNNADFKYNSLPESVNNINGNISVSKPQGILDSLKVYVKGVKAQIKNNPISLNALLTHPMSDPAFDAAAVGKINFNDLKDVFPMDSVDISGLIDADLKVNGRLSSIENKQYEKIKSDGLVLLQDFVYDAKNLTQKVVVPRGRLEFSPANVNLKQFNVKVGKSNFNLKGSVTNYLEYIFKKGNLKGNLYLSSDNVNVDELVALQKNNQPKSDTAKVKNLVFNVPENIDFNFDSKIAAAVFQNVPIKDVDGLITVKNGKLSLSSLTMKMLNGELGMNGSYQNTLNNQPIFDFGFNVLNFDIPLIYQFITGLQEFFPILSKSQGLLSSEFKINGRLNQKLIPIGTTVNGSGLLNTKDISINESNVFKELKGLFSENKVRNIKVDDFMSNFSVANGNMMLKPFKTKIGDQEAEILGSLALNKELNVTMNFDVQREVFGDDIKKILKAIPGEENIKTIPAAVTIKGNVKNPQVKVDLSKAQKAIAAEAQKAAKENLDKSLKKLGDGIKDLFK